MYVTQVMMDAGYGADDPALLLTHWKFYLRSITNAMIDAGIHCDGMTEDEAVRLMVDGGFQEEAEARAKYDRARLSSTQLSTYFAGSTEMWEIEREVRRRAAVASGDPRGAAAVPGTTGRGRVRRDARVPLPGAPRVGHLARDATDVTAPADPARVGLPRPGTGLPVSVVAAKPARSSCQCGSWPVAGFGPGSFLPRLTVVLRGAYRPLSLFRHAWTGACQA